MPVTGAGEIAKNIVSFGGGFQKHVKEVFKNVVDLLDIKITNNMSLSDHTLKDLADMDHPYATRHGVRGKEIHNPHWLVHTHTGLLLSAKKKGVTEPNISGGTLKITGYVGLDDSIADYAQYIIWGTSKMIPRDVLGNTLFDTSFRDEAQNHISKNLRDMVVNFRGVETK